MNPFALSPNTMVCMTAKDLQDAILTALSISQASSDRMLTTDEAIAEYKTSWSTLNRLRKAGILHPSRLGAQWRWSANELKNL